MRVGTHQEFIKISESFSKINLSTRSPVNPQILRLGRFLKRL